MPTISYENRRVAREAEVAVFEYSWSDIVALIRKDVAKFPGRGGIKPDIDNIGVELLKTDKISEPNIVATFARFDLEPIPEAMNVKTQHPDGEVSFGV